MYGFTGLGTNTYGSWRVPPTSGPLVEFPMITVDLSRTAGIIQPEPVVQNDFGYTIPFTLLDGDGNAVDLANAVLLMKVQSAQDPTDALVTMNGGMVIDGAAAGTCHYLAAQGDFPNPGTFLAQVVATWSSSEQLTWSGITIIVKPALPQSNN